MRKSALSIIFLTIFIDLLGFGLVIPILPALVTKTFGYPEIIGGAVMALFSLKKIGLNFILNIQYQNPCFY